METVAELPPNGGGRPNKYPWDEWTDGQTRVATKGVDYAGQSRSFVATLHGRAKYLGVHHWVRTRRGKDDEGRETVTFKFGKDMSLDGR